MELKITEANSKEELIEILILQEKNHRQNISTEAGLKNGFLSVRHELEVLKKMNLASPQIIAKAGDKVVAFAMVMLSSFKTSTPAMIPLFEMLEKISYKGKKITDYTYYIMGQICIDENYRSQGIFDKLYLKHKEVYSKQFDICVTEISSKNLRSMKAHQRVGFEVIHTFKDQVDEWNIVVWNWK
ncbi:MAG TPA: hypothetical protein VNW06_02875 [Cytophagaceae bacterium]|jgi:hypothetical protein|nr:hypothetical protein [Cytophagaceae bacterium]